MDEAELTSLLVGALTLISCPYLWRHRSSCPSFFMFFTCYYIFVVTGLVLMPWFRDVVGGILYVGPQLYVDLGSEINMFLFDSADYVKAIMLIGVGLLAAASGYIAGKFLQSNPRKVPRISSIQVQDSSQISSNSCGFDRARCFYLTATVTLIVFVLLAQRWSAVLSGLTNGFLAGSHEAVIKARFEVLSQNYITYVFACNVLPFFAVATWIAESRSSQLNRRIWALFIVVIATLYQFCIFQKRPAIVFLCMVVMATFLLGIPRSTSKRKMNRWLLLGSSALAVNSVLMILYYLSTSVRHEAENAFEAIAALCLISFTRIVGRLSMPALWYAHYFPKIEDHYGFSNIGLFSRVFGYEPYLDTVEVYYYVTGNPNGSGAICTVIDFYGGFGWLGCVTGSFLVGGLLSFLDAKIRDSNIKGSKVLLTIMACVFAYYLSQASMCRASLGYGGLFFIICWVLLGVRFRNKLRHPITVDTATTRRIDANHLRHV